MENITLTQAELEQKLAEARKGLFTEEDLNKKVTAEVDRRVESGIQKGIETHKAKWEQEYLEKTKMSAEELAQKQMQEKLEAMTQKEKELGKKANMLEAKSMLSDASVPKSHYDNFINMLVTDNEEVTKANVQNFINMFNATKLDIETKVKSELSKVKNPDKGGQGGAVTKQDFDKMGYSEKMKFKAENPELYKQFIK